VVDRSWKTQSEKRRGEKTDLGGGFLHPGHPEYARLYSAKTANLQSVKREGEYWLPVGLKIKKKKKTVFVQPVQERSANLGWIATTMSPWNKKSGSKSSQIRSEKDVAAKQIEQAACKN